MLYLRNGAPTTKLQWTAPTENTDGTPIDYELAYNLYVNGELFSSFPGSLNPEGKYETDIAPLGLPKGLNNLELTAFDTATPLRESDKSNAITINAVSVPLAIADFSAV